MKNRNRYSAQCMAERTMLADLYFKGTGLICFSARYYASFIKTIGISNTGNWSTKEYLPMGYLHNRRRTVPCFGR